MDEARKLWTRNYFSQRLKEVQDVLEQASMMNGGQMPYSLRKKVNTALNNNGKVLKALQNWKITSREKAKIER